MLISNIKRKNPGHFGYGQGNRNCFRTPKKNRGFSMEFAHCLAEAEDLILTQPERRQR